jgi:hypothetical protein
MSDRDVVAGELWTLERAGWEALSGGDPVAFYDRLLTSDAVMVLPGMVMDRDEVLRSWNGVTPWSDYRLDERAVVTLGGEVVALTYQATARRPGQTRPYRATMTSVYVRREDRWRLALHQQTPGG